MTKRYPLHHEDARPMYLNVPLEEYKRLNDRIADLEKENENLKYSVATLDTDLAMLKRWRKVSEELPEDASYVLATDGDGIWLCFKTTAPDDSPWFQPDGLPHIEGITHWMPLPEPPEVR